MTSYSILHCDQDNSGNLSSEQIISCLHFNLFIQTIVVLIIFAILPEAFMFMKYGTKFTSSEWDCEDCEDL